VSKFVLRKTASGVKFDLQATNGQVILSSEVYKTHSAAVKGIVSIQKSAADAPVEDQTGEDRAEMPNPKFEMYRDKAGQYRFRLKARNGRIVGVSEAYSSRTGCMSGMESVKINAGQAEIEG
jgi:uncharacterized protein YegP (UPF0339 family)